MPPLKAKDVEPASDVTEPPQLLVTPTGLAIMRPGWTPIKLSVHEALVNINALGL